VSLFNLDYQISSDIKEILVKGKGKENTQLLFSARDILFTHTNEHINVSPVGS
jgi:hypothetical protein